MPTAREAEDTASKGSSLAVSLRVIVSIFVVMIAGCAGRSSTVTAAGSDEKFLSDAELNIRMYECISANGFDGSLIDNGADAYVSFKVSPERQAVYDKVSEECYNDLVDLGLARGETVVASDADLRARYEHLLESARCLESEGISVDPPPSAEVYVRSGGTAWVPHAYVLTSGLSDEEINRIFRACPQ